MIPFDEPRLERFSAIGGLPHGYPLNALTTTLRQRAGRVTDSFLVASRLKRLVSIEHKLLRRQQVRATQIQDIGGCRVVLSSMKEVQALYTIYQKRSSRVFFRHRVDDYIERPKRDTGYRSLHMVYIYDSPRKPIYRNMRVELQIRSQLQHAWANAVETVAFFEGHDLKAGEERSRPSSDIRVSMALGRVRSLRQVS